MPDEAKLPGSAPDALKQFVACTTDRVELDLSQMDWVPKPPGMDSLPTPSATVADGWTARTATIKIGYGVFAIELPATIVDGELHIDTSNLQIGDIGSEIRKWVDAFNRTLREHDKQLDSFDMTEGKAAITKRPIPVAAAPAGATFAPATTGSTGTTPPAADDTSSDRRPGGCLGWLIGGIVAIAAAVGITLAVTGDDAGDDSITSGTGGPAAATTTTSSTTTEPPPAPATTEQVGQVPPPATDEVQETRVCGAMPDTGPWQSDPDAIARWEQATSWPCAPPTGGYGRCNPEILPCSTIDFVALTVAGMEGVNHDQSVPDAMTGEEGASTVEHALAMFAQTGDVRFLVKVISDCGGNTLSGQAPLVSNGPTIVEQRLLSFGECRVIETGLEVVEGVPDAALTEAVARSISASMVGRPYDIGPAEPDPSLPPGVADLTVSNSADDIAPTWHAPSITLGNTFAVDPLGQDCLWFFDASNTEVLVKVLDACQTGINDHFWVFYGATTDVEIGVPGPDTLIGTSGAYVNPRGIIEPGGADFRAFDTTAFYFDNSIYRCGYGHVAYTACGADPVPMEAGALVTVTGAALEPIPIEGDGTERIHEVDFGPVGGPAYRITQDADGWTVSSSAGATRARALLRENALMLVAPQDELPGGELAYVWRTTVDGQTHEQPAVPVAGLITTPVFPAEDAPADPPATDPPATDPPTTDEPASAESVEEFYAGLSRSISTGELDFALDRLDPTVYEAYPTECPAALESFVDPEFDAEPIDVGETGPWTWALPDGRSFEIADATTVTVVLTGRGQSGTEAEAHLTNIDDRWHWFTFCA